MRSLHPPDPAHEPGRAAKGSDLRELVGRLRGNPALQAISANTGWLLFDRVAGLAAGILITIVVARYLGPVNLGVLSYGLAIVGIAAPIAQLGFDGVVVRELIDHPDDGREILGTAATLLLSAGALLIPLVIIAAALQAHPGDHTVKIVAILAFQYIAQSLNVIDYWFRSALQSRYMVWSSKVGLLGNLIVSLLLLNGRAGVEMFAVPPLLEIVLTSASLAFFYRRSGRSIRSWRFSRSRAIALLRSGGPLLTATLAGTIYAKVDFILLRAFSTEGEVGIYSAATRVTELFYFVPMAIVVSVMPAMVRGRSSYDAERGARRMQALYDLMAVLGYAVVVPVCALAPFLIRGIFGTAFRGAGDLLAVHIWTLLVVGLGMARNSWLIAERLETFYLVSAVSGAVTKIVVDLLLIPRIGAMGAAYASVLSQVIIVLVSLLFVPRLRGVFKQLVLALLIPFRFRSLGRAIHEAAGGEL
jgi:PST family polysaccharide transporter